MNCFVKIPDSWFTGYTQFYATISMVKKNAAGRSGLPHVYKEYVDHDT